MIRVKLPYFILSDINAKEEEDVYVEAKNINDLYEVFETKYPEVLKKIFNEDRKIRNNVVLALNERIIKKSDYDNVKFKENQTLEILMQLSGG